MEEAPNSKSSTKPWTLNRQAPPKVLTCWKAPFCAWILQGYQTEDQGQQQLTTAYTEMGHKFIHSFMTHWSSTAPANAWWGRACTPSNECGQRVRRSCHTSCTGHYYYHPCWIQLGGIQLGFKPGEGIWERGRERWHAMWIPGLEFRVLRKRSSPWMSISGPRRNKFAMSHCQAQNGETEHQQFLGFRVVDLRFGGFGFLRRWRNYFLIGIYCSFSANSTNFSQKFKILQNFQTTKLE